jgi:hypothetical protein
MESKGLEGDVGVGGVGLGEEFVEGEVAGF